MNNLQDQYVICLISTPQEQAERIAKEFVSQKLAACAQILNPIHSIYWWQGKIDKSKECLLIIKTKRSLFNKLKVATSKIHPYSVPEIIALPLVGISKKYASWLRKETKNV